MEYLGRRVLRGCRQARNFVSGTSYRRRYDRCPEEKASITQGNPWKEKILPPLPPQGMERINFVPGTNLTAF